MNRLTIILFIVAISGWGAAYVLWTRPTPTPKTIVKTVDKAETKVVYKETTKPDGTVIKETSTTQQDVKIKTDIVSVPFPRTKWMVGAQVFPQFTDKMEYGGEIGRRLGDSPLWIKAGYNSKQELTLGLSIEF
jgi:hypothetical protein